MNFDQAFEILIGHEGGYVNDPNDPGGETKYGISKRAYPGEDIRAMTEERAKMLYKRDYWGPSGADSLPDAIKFDVFDTAVNAGVKTAIRMLQRAVREIEDGILGPRTLQAANSFGGDKLRLRFSAVRRLHWASLTSWKNFGKGWTIRQANNDLREDQ